MEALPSLNALRVFEVVGRLGSITLAADELCVTPAAVSRQISTLEAQVGCRLFIRQHRGIAPTPQGAAYHAELARLFAGLRRATDDLRGGAQRKVFKLRAPHTVAMRWLLPRLASLHQDQPDLEVRLHTSVAPPDFEREDLDAGIILGTPADAAGLVCHRIMANEIAPVCTPEKAAGLRSASQLLGETLLHTQARPDDWQAWFRAAGLPAAEAGGGLRYESSALAFEAALAGYGIAIGHRALVARELEDGRLVAPFGQWVDLGDYTYYAVMPPETYKRKSRALAAFRHWIESLAA